LARANIASRGTFSDDLPDGWCCYSSFVQRARTTVVSRAIRPVGFGQHASGKARGVRQTRHAACGRRASSSLGVRPKIDFLRTDPTREVIHIGLSGTVGVV